jgi:hypothetical protein
MNSIFWLAVPAIMIYLLIFCERLYSIKRLYVFLKQQCKDKKHDIVSDDNTLVTYYSTLLLAEQYTTAEVLYRNSFHVVSRLRGILKFNFGIVSIQKGGFAVLKLIFLFIRPECNYFQNQIMVPMNIISIVLNLVFLLYKFKDMEKRKIIHASKQKEIKKADTKNKFSFVQKIPANITQLETFLFEHKEKLK